MAYAPANATMKDAAMSKQSFVSKKSISEIATERYVARLAAEETKLSRHYCDVFKFWRVCPSKPCRRARCCAGDPHICLQRNAARLSHRQQWQARQRVLLATPVSAGPPERTAREMLPSGLVELFERRQRSPQRPR